MLEHEKRVVDECTELEVKIDKLIEFMHGDFYPTLPAIDQGLLMVQIRNMQSYANVLRDRIERFGRNDKAL